MRQEPWSSLLVDIDDALDQRDHSELRPWLVNTDRHDLTIRLWLEMLSEAGSLHAPAGRHRAPGWLSA
jgi:hypothetical protein